MQLFCFTYAGGTAAFFNQLEAACAGKIDFVKLEYPGHGLRRKMRLIWQPRESAMRKQDFACWKAAGACRQEQEFGWKTGKRKGVSACMKRYS